MSLLIMSNVLNLNTERRSTSKRNYVVGIVKREDQRVLNEN